MIMNKKLFISLSLLIPLSWFYTEANAAEAQQLRKPLPPQDSPEYWVLRSEAVRELTAFMTKKRKELKDKYAYFPGYLEEIGKTADFRSSGRKIPGDVKYRLEVLGLLDAFEQRNIQLPENPMNWTQVINVAMQFVWAEGHLETNIESGEELQRFKDILQRKERFCMKVRSDVKVTVDACVQAWFYLETIDQQPGFRVYVFQEQLKENEAKMKRQAERSAQARDERRKAELQRRQARLRYRYGYGY